MRIEKRQLKDLISPDYNPRTISESAMESLKTSLKEFGYIDYLIVNEVNNHIVGGNQRAEAMKQLGYSEVDVILINEPDIDREKMINIRLNNSSGEWNTDKLESILQDLELKELDVSLTGFDIETLEIQDLNNSIPTNETITSDLNTGLKPENNKIEVTDDDYVEPEEEITVKINKGDLYQLGNHRLLCGDSTKTEDVKLLMNNNKADITFTSPPYNTQQGMKNNPLSTDSKYGINNYYKIKNNKFDGNVYKNYEDNLSDDEYSNLLIESAKQGLKHSDDVLFNIGVLKGSKIGITNLLHELQNNFLDILIWNKSTAMPLGLKSQEKMVSHICELIFCFNKKGNRSFTHAQWQKGTKTNRIDSINATNNPEAKKHKATFPIEFASQIIQDFSENSVLDLFGGSGTTLIACEQLQRTCYMMELDPYYCQVIINRWEEFTGKEAVKIN